jgi:hypothetical protein
MLNDAREKGLSHTGITFTPGLKEESHKSARQEVGNAEIMMARRAHRGREAHGLEDRYPEK